MSTGEALETLIPADGGGFGSSTGLEPDSAGLPLPGVEPSVAARVAKVASACTERRNDVLSAAVSAHRVGVAAARTALIEVEKVMPVLPGSSRDKVFAHFLNLPPGSGAKMIRELSQRVVATYADEDFLSDVDGRLDAAESVNWSELPNGMHRLTADLTPVHAAQVKHAVDALSAPAPGNTCCDDVFHRHAGGEKTTVPDARTAQKRRADGFMLLLTRGADQLDDDGAITTSGHARIVVTIDHEVLAERLRGCGRTEAGTALNAQQVRQLACGAEILPIVLGSRGDPLDVGRAPSTGPTWDPRGGGRTRSMLHLPGVRPSTELVSGSSSCAVVARRGDLTGQLGPALPATSNCRAPRGLCRSGGQDRRDLGSAAWVDRTRRSGRMTRARACVAGRFYG